MPPPPAAFKPPPMWGIADHIQSMFQAAGATPSLAVETVEFGFSSVEDTVRTYADEFGPFVIAHSVLGPQGRFRQAILGVFADLVRRFNTANDETARIQSGYFLISIDR